MLKDGLAARVSPETVRLLLKKTNSSLGKCGAGVFQKLHQSSSSAWNIFWSYTKNHDSKRPTVCFDEKSFQLLLAHITHRLGLKPGRAARQDYTCTWRQCRCEYKRNGTRNLFIFVEPKIGSATHHRTKQDFAFARRYLVDVIYPEAERIDVVMDNLNTIIPWQSSLASRKPIAL